MEAYVEKSRALADLEYLEGLITTSSPEELYEASSSMYNLSVRNMGKIKGTSEEELKGRYISVVNTLITYLPNVVEESKPDPRAKNKKRINRLQAYCSKKRWNSFFHQVDEIISLYPDSVLEIGVGTGFLGAILKKVYKLNYTSLDIREEVKPDIVGSVLDIPFTDNQFDVVCCYEVLEHLPYEHFEKGLSEIFRVAKYNVIISLPNDGKEGIPHREIWAKSGHKWEINRTGFEYERVIADFMRVATLNHFELIKEYRVDEWNYHHFFVFKNNTI